MLFADVDAVTIDAYGTLVELDDPVGRLRDALRRHGVERDEATVASAFRTEVDFYSDHKHEGRDTGSLARLRHECTRVFLEAADAGIGADAFVDDFVASIVVSALPGAHEAVAAFRARGLAIGVVSNWDAELRRHLEGAGFDLDVVVTSAEVGAAKPDPRPILVALEQLAVAPARALHIGDSDADEQAARAAGTRFQRFESWS